MRVGSKNPLDPACFEYTSRCVGFRRADARADRGGHHPDADAAAGFDENGLKHPEWPPSPPAAARSRFFFNHDVTAQSKSS